MNIHTIPLKISNDLFNEYHAELLSLQTAKYCFVTSEQLITKLHCIELPIANRRLALRNILTFLTFLDEESKKANSTLFPIHSKKLIEFFTRNHYKQYMALLKSLSVISDVAYNEGHFYKIGERSKLYRIHDNYYKASDLCIVVLDNDRSRNNFCCEISTIDKRFIKTVKTVDLNIQAAVIDEVDYCRLNKLPSSVLRYRLSRLFYTRMKRFIKSGTKVSRIYHSFTTLSKVSRRHLNVKFMSIDIVNCQPLLLVAYLKKNSLAFDSNYQRDCEKGILYENLLTEEIQMLKETDPAQYKIHRDRLKEKMYSNILFSFCDNNALNKTFKSQYPLTWASLNYLSKNGVSMAQQLQNLESDLFNKLVPAKSKYFFTLFDAIYYDNVCDTAPLVKSINEYFDQLQIKVEARLEYL